MPMLEAVETRIAAVDPTQWIDAAAAGQAQRVIRSADLADAIAPLQTQPPLEHLGVLRGLCRRALLRFYLETEDEMPLDRGTPVPIASRPVNELFGSTPNPVDTLAAGHLLHGLAYKIFEFSAQGPARVVLDYTHRDRLDEITWTRDHRLPRIATIHPFLGAQAIEIAHNTGTAFFGVRPKNWNREALLAKLCALSTVPIAVLPELCLPVPDALEEALAEEPSAYPALVVAGSAHVTVPAAPGLKEVRANESHIYLDGHRVAVHRKIHPFKTRHLGGHNLAAREEGITREVKTITVLSGEHTRLAVVICADLNDETIPGLLEGAGVNLLLVPAMTGGAGAFNGAICGLASRCQAVGVIVNAGLDPRADDEDDARPFLIMASVPRPEAEAQARSYRDHAHRRTAIGIIDPNEELETAMQWLDLETEQAPN
jgi:predicted amidohydrolase